MLIGNRNAVTAIACAGEGLELMRLFFTLLPQRTNWHQKAADPAEFIIDETFGVPGVGTVVAGINLHCMDGVRLQ